MKRRLTGTAAVSMILPAMLLAGAREALPAAGGPAAASGYTLTVLNPQGSVKKSRDLAPRLGTLNGKRIAMWLSATPDEKYAGKGEELYDALAKMLKEKFADIRIVSYRDLPMKFAPESDVISAIVAAKPDAVVAAFGG